MKKIAFLCVIASTLLYSCKPVEYTQFQQWAGFIDYSSFPGMFLTESNSVGFDYQPIGSLYAEETSGVVKKTMQKIENNEVYGEGYEVVDTKYRRATPQSALEFAAQKAKDMGGNGIINLHIQSKDKGYCVTGMVIRRK